MTSPNSMTFRYNLYGDLYDNYRKQPYDSYAPSGPRDVPRRNEYPRHCENLESQRRTRSNQVYLLR